MYPPDEMAISVQREAASMNLIKLAHKGKSDHIQNRLLESHKNVAMVHSIVGVEGVSKNDMFKQQREFANRERKFEQLTIRFAKIDKQRKDLQRN